MNVAGVMLIGVFFLNFFLFRQTFFSVCHLFKWIIKSNNLFNIPVPVVVPMILCKYQFLFYLRALLIVCRLLNHSQKTKTVTGIYGVNLNNFFLHTMPNVQWLFNFINIRKFYLWLTFPTGYRNLDCMKNSESFS